MSVPETTAADYPSSLDAALRELRTALDDLAASEAELEAARRLLDE